MNTLSFRTCMLIVPIYTLLLCSCNNSGSSSSSNNSPLPTPPPTAKDVAPSSLTGIWEKSGYGQILQIESGVISDYQVSTNTCLLKNEFLANEYDAFLVEVVLAADEQSFDTKTEHISDYPHAYTFNKLDYLPEACSDANIILSTTSAAINYEVLWDTFNDYYAFMELRQVDWNNVDEQSRPFLDQIFDNESLLSIFKEMLQDLKDGHVSIRSELDGFVWNAGEHPTWFVRVINYFEENYPQEGLQQAFDDQQDFNDFIEFKEAVFAQYYQELATQNLENIQNYLSYATCGADGHICWGTTVDNIGYLSIDAMQGYLTNSEEQDTENDLVILNSALDEAFLILLSTNALIIDIRQNQGGQDRISLEIAGRFIEQRKLSYRKQARNKDGFANQHDIYIEPKGNSPYIKPLYILTSGGTYSGAETFALSLAGLPQVTLIGEPSGGILSDMISKELPNGWQFTLSTEIYSDLNGNVFEGVGLPVDYFVDFYIPENIIAGHDTTIERALSLINGE